MGLKGEFDVKKKKIQKKFFYHKKKKKNEKSVDILKSDNVSLNTIQQYCNDKKLDFQKMVRETNPENTKRVVRDLRNNAKEVR